MAPARQREWATRTAKDRHDSATRAALLRAAEERFAEQGYARTSVAQIAAGAGVARATFYVYFASRRDVFHALALQLRDEITRVQRDAGGGSGDPRAIVESSIHAALAIYARRARLLTVIRHQALHDAEAAALWSQLVTVPTEIDERFLAGLQRAGVISPQIPRSVIARVVTGALLHLAEEVAERPEASERLADGMIAAYERLTGLDEV